MDSTFDRIKTERNLHELEQTGDYNQFLQQVKNAVLEHLENIMGPAILVSVNHHLRILANVDISQVMSDPSAVEAGLKKLFGVGSKVIIQQCVFAAFRSVGLIPDRDFSSLEDAIREMRKRTLAHVI